MVAIHLTGRINNEGKREVSLPQGLTPGQVNVTIEMTDDRDLPWELRPWTAEEVAALMRVEPQSGAEIVAWLEQAGGWEDQGISDSAAEPS